ncbi:CRISPR-associated CARF protein Csx1 [Carboxydothermus ferrireducens]|uniref:CRISPR-associated protein Csx1 n=1 Tax=Carboxydothermus ferrireducens DSM 11255 TaxID=1119529 RepID=A0ABX2RCB0_9THEO|nr:CRISPR-associated CARF protein Csx1 [Carboxydothermus ferrireducens]NYE58834.1 CRISPR-associated protein Csx1 [Carboxydothermus ferrireducens DSM 11255]
MNLIYQIGRLDRGCLNLVKFKKDCEIFEASLSSLALKKYLENQGEKTQLVIIYPISLPLNKTLLGAEFPLELKEAINQCINNPQVYLNNPEEFFKLLNSFQGREEFIIIHSLGSYLGIDFQSSFDDIVLEIFIDMINRYLSLGFKNLYVDISSGHNIYVTALLEALRHFHTWVNLRNWANDSKLPEIFVSFSDPILGNTEAQVFNLYWEEIKYKTFFSSPLSSEDAKGNFAQILTNLFGDNRQQKREVRPLLESFSLIFSAIKNNVPLILYKYGYHDSKVIKKVFCSVLNHTYQTLYRNYKDSPILSKSSYTKTILALGFYWGISEILKILRVHKDENNDGVKIDEIKEKFEKVYEIFGLVINKQFLGTELSNSSKKINEALDDPDLSPEIKNKILSEEWVSLIDIHKGRKAGNPDPRNFFAHAGMEGNVTEARKQGSQIFVRIKDKYEDSNGKVQDVANLLKNWLYNEI